MEIRKDMTLKGQHADWFIYMKGTISQDDGRPWNEYNDDNPQLLKFSIHQE